MVSIAYHAELAEVQGDARLCHLLDAASQHAPFDRLAWWQGLARHCGIAPLLAVASDGTQRAVLPLRQEPGRLEALANWYTFRWRPLFTLGADAPALLAALARDLRHRAVRIVLAGVPDDDGAIGSATLLGRAFASAGWLVLRRPCDTNHILRVQGRSFERYLRTRPGALRTTLNRKQSRVSTEVLATFDAAAWDAYEEIYRASWKPAEGSPAFLRAFAIEEGTAGRLRLGIARIDGQPVAAQMWTVEGETAFIHKLAHRQDARALSPGTVLTAALMRHVIDTDRVALVDFGTGDDPYKRDWMEDTRTRHRLELLRPSSPRNWPIMIRAGMRKLARTGNDG